MRKSKKSRNQSHQVAPTTEENLYIQDKLFQPGHFLLDRISTLFKLFFCRYDKYASGIFLFSLRDMMGYLGKSIMGIFAC